MAENNNSRLSRRDRHSQERKSVMPGGYISRGNNNPTNNGQQRRPLTNEEIMRRNAQNAGSSNQQQRAGNANQGQGVPLLDREMLNNQQELVDQEGLDVH